MIAGGAVLVLLVTVEDLEVTALLVVVALAGLLEVVTVELTVVVLTLAELDVPLLVDEAVTVDGGRVPEAMP